MRLNKKEKIERMKIEFYHLLPCAAIVFLVNQILIVVFSFNHPIQIDF